MTNREQFMEVYTRNLTRAVNEQPETYNWPVEIVPIVATKMFAAMDQGDYNKNSPPYAWTCKELGIKNTYKAIKAYWKGDSAETCAA